MKEDKEWEMPITDEWLLSEWQLLKTSKRHRDDRGDVYFGYMVDGYWRTLIWKTQGVYVLKNETAIEMHNRHDASEILRMAGVDRRAEPATKKPQKAAKSE